MQTRIYKINQWKMKIESGVLRPNMLKKMTQSFNNWRESSLIAPKLDCKLSKISIENSFNENNWLYRLHSSVNNVLLHVSVINLLDGK